MLNRMVEGITNVVDIMIILSIGLLLIFVIPELINRVVKDSLMNWFNSVWVSFRLRKYIESRIAKENGSDYNTQCRNKLIRSAVIDIRNQSVTYIVKLPNNLNVQKDFLEAKEMLYTEIASRFPNYSFSDFKRDKHQMIMEGTKFRR